MQCVIEIVSYFRKMMESYLGNKPKISVVSWVKSTKSDIFKTEKVFMARDSITVLKRRIEN